MRACRGLALAALAILAGGCRHPEEAPNLVLVTIDTLRADHTTPYGYGRDTTPVLARLAREGVAVDLAYAPMATTGPSHAALLTSRYPVSSATSGTASVSTRRRRPWPSGCARRDTARARP